MADTEPDRTVADEVPESSIEENECLTTTAAASIHHNQQRARMSGVGTSIDDSRTQSERSLSRSGTVSISGHPPTAGNNTATCSSNAVGSSCVSSSSASSSATASANTAAAISRKPECVRVVIRCRPLSQHEHTEAVEMDEERFSCSLFKTTKGAANNREAARVFTYDAVYGPLSTQQALYDETAYTIVESVMEGYNGTIFAYGQTGTGKTHTMVGQDNPPDMQGITPRAFEQIFNTINCTNDKKFLVRASFLEIYNEEIRDLLSRNPKDKLDLKDHPDHGVYVKGLSTFVVKGVEEMRQVLVSGQRNRSVGATLMNIESSRSHSIFTITVESCEMKTDGENHIRVGKLNMVDLAGSERQSKTGATGDTLKEAAKINLSLSALGNVISALVDSKTSFVPYRDSKLTRLLQDSLGGNTKTVMVANVGPADYNYDETLSTLRYAHRAKSIKNKPTINEDPKDAMIREFQEEIARLRAELADRTPQLVHTEPKVVEVPKEVVVEKVVEKVIVQKDTYELKQLQETVDAEREEIHRTFAEERKQIEAAKSIAEEEKRKLVDELKDREEQQEKQKQSQEELISQVKAMEDKMLQGSQVMYRAMLQQQELKRAQIELEERRKREKALAVAMEKREEERQAFYEERYTSQNESLDKLQQKLAKVWTEYRGATNEISDLHEEFQQEREDLQFRASHGISGIDLDLNYTKKRFSSLSQLSTYV
eukprot:GHVQ01011628.1.p1 GENE.GHVQ01011628.1~~GHVQ01011628.1.p1  ORF type:complete len:714 (-),score=113.15 GHVQ01011628.1:3424-5565(-)